MTITVSNEAARRVFLAGQGLAAPPARALGKEGLLRLITDLGFVQVDSIATVERAHHQILFSRNQTYRREHLRELLEKDRLLFEHWTHDAAILPASFYPYWKRRFKRDEEAMTARWRKWQGEGFDSKFQETYARIAAGGPVMARDVKEDDHAGGGWWNWHPSKTALEYLWRIGKLSIAGRVNFQKVYDLTERVLHKHHHEPEVEEAVFVDWACRQALARLGFATAGEIAAFFDIISVQEVKAWIAAQRGELQEVAIVAADGKTKRPSFALAGLDAQAEAEPPARVRVLSPFDPLLRDRDRAQRLFGFYYRIEVFVPREKRQYGYYVFPLLEKDRLIGRIDMRAERKEDRLDVRRLWLEPQIRASTGRLEKLDAELSRLARFTGVSAVRYLDGWLGEA